MLHVRGSFVTCSWYSYDTCTDFLGSNEIHYLLRGGNMARFTQFPLMITRSTVIYEIISPGATGSSIYV